MAEMSVASGDAMARSGTMEELTTFMAAPHPCL
jgi:hypothetical protein